MVLIDCLFEEEMQEVSRSQARYMFVLCPPLPQLSPGRGERLSAEGGLRLAEHINDVKLAGNIFYIVPDALTKKKWQFRILRNLS